jgi:pyridoxal phosphate enzyme (YggS family)
MTGSTTPAELRDGDREITLTATLAKLRQRLAHAAEAVGRKPADIELLPVTKFFPATDIAILNRLGCHAFGESRDQEAREKIDALAAQPSLLPPGTPARGIAWHMIGQVQRKKAKSVAAWAHTVHSVDTERIATALDSGATAAIRSGARTGPLRVYVQLSLDGDTARGGVDIDDKAGVDAVCDHVAAADALELVGVMGVPPLEEDPDTAFARLAEEHRRVRSRHPQAVGLSAGMSGDLEIAIKHGSTCVRVGSALLGQRPLTSP